MRKALWDEFEGRSWAQGGRNPRSGRGSNMRSTKGIRETLPRLFDTYKVKTFLNAPYGNWFWMQHVDLTRIKYIVGDVSQSLVEEISAEHASSGVSFRHIDVISDPLPKADMMMCRDCLFHLSHDVRWSFYKNFVKSKVPYLLSTVNYNAANKDLMTPGWEPHNPFLPPFEIATPLEYVLERGDAPLPDDWRDVVAHPDAEKYRSMAVWSSDQIVDLIKRQAA
jgi:hypothetical protein